ncbi:MAG: hypothetical protein WCP57_03920 [Bacteroidota bacterium]
MNSQIIKYLSHCILILVIQILALNYINVSGLINPYMYPLLILMLPLNTPKYILLFTALFIGLSVDIFQETLGMHAFATIFIAFLRPYVFKILNPKEQEADEIMDIHYHGFTWFAIYLGVFTFIHHLLFFRIEKGDFHAYHYTLLKTVLSTVFSLISMFIYIFLTSNKSSTRYN